MTSKLLTRVAVAAALAGTSLSAFALTPAQVPASNRIYVGGATATDLVLRDVFLASGFGLCDPAQPVDVYEANNQRAVLCRARAGLGSPYNLIQGQPVGYVKESNGGSGNGTQPVANQTALTFLDLDKGSFACSVNTTVPAGGGLIGYNLHTSCTPNGSRVPGAGIADVEGRLLNASADEQARLAPTGLLDIVFGVPVSTPLYRALQAAQGLTTNDDCGNSPTLTRAQVVGMYTGLLVDAAQLVAADEGDDGTELPAGQIFVCRRGDTSGTQAGSEAYWLRQRCESGVVSFASPDDSNCLTNGCSWNAGTYQDDAVFAASSSTHVRNCLDGHGDAGEYAVGVLSTESNPFTSGQSFRWVRVEGAVSTLEQTANSNYEFFTSNVLNRRNPNVLSTLQNQIANYFVNNVGNPQFVAALNAPFQNGICQNGFGDGGVLAVAGTTVPNGVEAPFSGAEVRGAPINTMTKQPFGTINNCQSPIVFGEQAAGGQFRPSVPTYTP